MSAITILHIDNSVAVTGAYKALSDWCRHTPEYRHVWVLPEGSAVSADARKHFEVYSLPFVEIGRSPARLLNYLPALFSNGRRLKAIISKEQPGLVHINDLYNLVPYMARWLDRQKRPIVVHARMLRRSFPARIYDFWEAWHLKHADGIVAVSKAIRADWHNHDRVQVAYDSVPVKEKLPPYQFRRAAGEPFRFIYLANYIPGKGQADALEAIRILRQRGIDHFTVDFYGGTMGLEKNDQYRQHLLELVRTHQLQDVVTLNGPVTDVEATMKGYHCALHFSHSESFGMVCFEALYYGLPVISSDCGGPAEMMVSGKSGILLPVGDAPAFAAAMTELMRDEAYCRQLSQNAPAVLRAHIVDGTAEINRLFKELINRWDETHSNAQPG